MNKIAIQYFSDILCIWAYVAQARLDELNSQYRNQIAVSYHFVSVYGNTQKRVIENWQERGGVPAYVNFVRGVANDFGHVTISDKFWADDEGPRSSASVHCFLKAVANLERKGLLDNAPLANHRDRTLFEELVWQLRKRYFTDAINIGLLENQLFIASDLGIEPDLIRENLEDGSAFASLCEDNELKEKYRIEGSPTYVLNEGRQKLYGNVGYKIIAANIEELINRPEGVASWC